MKSAHLALPLLLAVILGVQSRSLAQPAFRYLLRGEGAVEGEPGQPVEMEVRVLIESGGLEPGDPGPEAWSLALRATDCLFRELTTAGTEVEELVAGLEQNVDTFVHLDFADLGTGATVATVLGLKEAIALDPLRSPNHVLTATVEGTVPGQGGCRTCRVVFENGIRAGGRPVRNVATWKSKSFAPALEEKEILLCDSLCNRLPILEVRENSSPVVPASFDRSLRRACFRVNARRGEPLVLELADQAGEDSGNSHTVHVKCGEEATPANADFAAEERGRANQRLVIPEACGELIHVLVLAPVLADEERGSEITLSLRELTVAAGSIFPRRAARGERVTAAIRGRGFGDTSTFTLRHPGGSPEFPGTVSSIVSSREAHVVFDVPANLDDANADRVLYDLVIGDTGAPGEVFDRLERVFQVELQSDEAFQVEILGRDRIRVGRLTSVTVRYENTGNVQIPAPLFFVTGPPGTRLRQATDGQFRPETGGASLLQFLGVNEQGVPGVLAAGAVGEVPIELVAGPRVALLGTFRVEHLTPNVNDPVPWGNPAIRPPGMSEDVWADSADAFKMRLGESWGEYVQNLAAIATDQSQRGKDPSSALEAFRQAVKEILGRPTLFLRGRITTEDFVPLDGVLLFAVTPDNGGDRVATCGQSNSEGRFALDDLEPGTYRIEARGHGIAGPDRTFLLEAGTEHPFIELRARPSVDPGRAREECPEPDQTDLPLALPRPPEDPPVLTEKTEREVVFVGSWDPNEKSGSTTRGGKKLGRRKVDPSLDRLEYDIYFENLRGEGRVPAQTVEIIDDGSDLDLASVVFREVAIADVLVHLEKPGLTPLERRGNAPGTVFPFTSRCDGDVPGFLPTGDDVNPFIQNRTEEGFSGSLTLRINHLWPLEGPEQRSWPLLLDIHAEVDFVREEIRWLLGTRVVPRDTIPCDDMAGPIRCIEADDPDLGFLLPNEPCSVERDDDLVIAGRGEAHVSFTASPRASLRDRKRIRNRATIRFDANDPIPVEVPDGDVIEFCRDGPPAAAHSPQPADAQLDVSPGQTLRWESDCRAEIHELFLWKEGDARPAEPTAVLEEPEYRAELDPRTPYLWRVVPRNEDGAEPDDPVFQWSFVTADPPPPCTPEILSPRDRACRRSREATLRWRSESGCNAPTTGHAVFLSPAPLAPPEFVDTVIGTEFTLPAGSRPAEPGEYFWKVVALNADYPDAATGRESALASFLLCPPAPATGLSPDQAECLAGVTRLTWTAGEGAEVHDVLLTGPDPGVPPIQLTSPGTELVLPDGLELVPGGDYRWQVFARNFLNSRPGTGIPSEVARFSICEGTPFIRGDVDGSGGINITDPIYLLDYLFRGGPPPPCLEAANADGMGGTNITDPIYLLDFLFRGGPALPLPYPECGIVPGVDCEEFMGCR